MVIKVLDKGKIIWDWDMKLEIHLFIWDFLTNLTTKDNSKFQWINKNDNKTFVCSLRRQYPPLTLLNLQKLIDLDRLDTSRPIDLVSLLNTGVYKINPDDHHFGVNLTDEGADLFKAKVNIEVQWASELVIATIERNGGTITTAYYDPHSLQAMVNTKKFFERGNLAKNICIYTCVSN